MKKNLLIVIAFLFSVSSFAQERTSMISISASLESFNNLPFVLIEKQINVSFLGAEYSEIKGRFGFRAGINYANYTKSYNPNLFSDEFYLPGRPRNRLIKSHLIDFPLTTQFYLGKKKLKTYGNIGLASTLLIPSDEEEDENSFIVEEVLGKNLSFRGILGIGLAYQFSNHFGIDISVNQKARLITFGENIIRPLNSFGIQTKINYIF